MRTQTARATSPTRRRVALGLAAGLLCSGPVAGTARAKTATAESWFTYGRTAHYSAVYSFVQIPMRDGTMLACDLQQPGTGTPGSLDAPGSTPAPGRYPGIISNYTPYTAANPASAVSASPYAALGYDVLNCDTRGLGRSQVTAPGQVWMQPYAAIQTQDNFDMIEWLAAQPFSNGSIGQTGGSAGAVTSTLVAAMHPPHLKAIVSLTAPDNMYSDSRYKGGALVAWGPAWAVAAGGLSGGGANPALILAQFKLHPNDDAYWQQQSPSSSFDSLTIPDLQLEGWGDTDFPTGALRIFEGTKRHITSDGSSGPFVVQGPWGHAGAPTCTVSPGCGVTLAFFDHYLRHDKRAPTPPARVQIYQQTQTGGRWHTLSSWPPSGTRKLLLHLTRTKALSAAAGPAAARSFTVGQSDIATAGTAAERANQFLSFASAPMTRGTAVSGDPFLQLVASITGDDAIFVVQLQDIAPDGTTTNVSGVPWILKASHRTSHVHPTPVIPGARGTYTVRGWSMDYVFAKGHRIGMKIASAVDLLPPSTPFPNNLMETAPDGDVSIATGTGGSYLSLPVTSPR